jgi:hypothetical protein
VQARWFIIQHIGKDHAVYVVNGLLMMAAFFACRVVPVMPYNVWAVHTAAAHADAALPFHVRAAAACLILPNLLNLYWASLMLNGFVKLFSKKGKKAKKEKGGGESRGLGAGEGAKEGKGLAVPPPPPLPPPPQQQQQQQHLKAA